MTEVHQCSQEPVDEDQPMLCASPDGTLPRPGHQSRLVTVMPQPTQLDNEFGDHLG